MKLGTPHETQPYLFYQTKIIWRREKKILVVKEFLSGNVQIGFKSQRLWYKTSCMELGTSRETQSYLHYQTKIQIWEWGRERERDREERDWWNPIYKSMLRNPPLLDVAPAAFFSLFYLPFFYGQWQTCFLIMLCPFSLALIFLTLVLSYR